MLTTDFIDLYVILMFSLNKTKAVQQTQYVSRIQDTQDEYLNINGRQKKGQHWFMSGW